MDRSRLVVLFYVAVAAVLLPLVGWLLWRHNKQRTDLGEAWRVFAQSRGLKHSLDAEGRWPILEGRWSGVRVRVRVSKHGVDHPTYLPVYEAIFEQPLALPAEARVSSRDDRSTASPEQAGNPAVSELVRGFLSSAGLQLRTVTAERASIECNSRESDPAELAARLDEAAAFARSVEQARK